MPSGELATWCGCCLCGPWGGPCRGASSVVGIVAVRRVAAGWALLLVACGLLTTGPLSAAKFRDRFDWRKAKQMGRIVVDAFRPDGVTPKDLQQLEAVLTQIQASQRRPFEIEGRLDQGFELRLAVPPGAPVPVYVKIDPQRKVNRQVAQQDGRAFHVDLSGKQWRTRRSEAERWLEGIPIALRGIAREHRGEDPLGRPAFLLADDDDTRELSRHFNVDELIRTLEYLVPEENRDNLAAQRCLRIELCQLVDHSVGLLRQDALKAGRPPIAPFVPKFVLGGYNLETGAWGDPVQASHSWGGDVDMRNTNHHRDALHLLRFLFEGGPEPTGTNRTEAMRRAARALGVLIHETLHGYSPFRNPAYFEAGAAIEEASNEVATRLLVRRFLQQFDIYTDQLDLPRSRADRSVIYRPQERYYDQTIWQGITLIAKGLGWNEQGAASAMVQASLRMKTAVGIPLKAGEEAPGFIVDGKWRMSQSPQEHVWIFVSGIPGIGLERRRQVGRLLFRQHRVNGRPPVQVPQGQNPAGAEAPAPATTP